MNNFRVFFIIALSLLVGACAPRSDDKSNLPPAPTPYSQPGKNEVPLVQYPVAVMYEFGEGDPLANSGKKVVWQLYFCLQKSTENITGNFELDLQKLSKIPIILNRLVLQNLSFEYSYVAEQVDPNANFGYSFGLAEGFIKSEHQWHPMDQKHIPLTESQKNGLRIFDYEFSKGKLGDYGVYRYQQEDLPMYISLEYLRYTYERKTNESRSIEVCEREKSRFVFVNGSSL